MKWRLTSEKEVERVPNTFFQIELLVGAILGDVISAHGPERAARHHVEGDDDDPQLPVEGPEELEEDGGGGGPLGQHADRGRNDREGEGNLLLPARLHGQGTYRHGGILSTERSNNKKIKQQKDQTTNVA